MKWMPPSNEDCRIVYKGESYYRHPGAKHKTDRLYFRSKKKKFLHREIYKDNFGEIPTGYLVHHVDGNPLNNIPENLKAISRSGHMRLHAKETWDRLAQLEAEAKFRYSVKDICYLISAARECGVARLKTESFSVSFLTATPKASQPAAPPTPEQNEAFNVTERENLADLEERLKQDYLMNLRLSDPEEYEDLINRQELTDAGAGPETTLPG
jgi:hypothetical protein